MWCPLLLRTLASHVYPHCAQHGVLTYLPRCARASSSLSTSTEAEGHPKAAEAEARVDIQEGRVVLALVEVLRGVGAERARQQSDRHAISYVTRTELRRRRTELCRRRTELRRRRTELCRRRMSEEIVALVLFF